MNEFASKRIKDIGSITSFICLLAYILYSIFRRTGANEFFGYAIMALYLVNLYLIVRGIYLLGTHRTANAAISRNSKLWLGLSLLLSIVGMGLVISYL